MRLAALAVLVPAFTLQACKGCADEEQKDTNPQGTDDPEADVGDVGSWLSMRTMSDGSPAIAYYDRTQDALGFAIGSIGSDGTATWSREQVDSYPDENGLNPGDSGKYASMAIASDGTVWIAYQDSSHTKLRYAKRDAANSWTVGDADSSASDDAGYWTSIVFDSSGNPVIAHYDKGEGSLRVATWNGSAFTSEVVYDGQDGVDTAGATVAGNAGEYAKLLSDGGTLYLAFYDHTQGALRLATKSGSSWNVEVVDDEGDVGAWPDLVMDGGKLLVAYQDVGAQHLKFAKGSPGSFTTEVVDSSDHVGADTALFVDGSTYGILYYDGANNDLKEATGSPGSWSTRKVAGDDAALGFHNETVSTGGKRYAACYDYTNRGLWFQAL